MGKEKPPACKAEGEVWSKGKIDEPLLPDIGGIVKRGF